MTAIPPARSIIQEAINIPDGVRLYELKTHVDHRGEFTELFRETWSLGPRPLQWNLVWSSANVLRGVHVHREHADYLTVGAGELILGLHDMRPSAATYGRSMLLRLRADDPYIAVVPPGVAHGFYFGEPACHIYAVSKCFDGSDEFGCSWNDPSLRLAWPCAEPLLSERDRTAGSYSEMAAALAR